LPEDNSSKPNGNSNALATNTHAHMRGYTHYKPNLEDKDKIKKMVLLGAPHEKIAASLGISLSTLTKYYRDVLDYYKTHMLSQVATRAYAMAIEGHPVMTPFVLRTQGGWKENLEVEETLIVKRVVGIHDADV